MRKSAYHYIGRESAEPEASDESRKAFSEKQSARAKCGLGSPEKPPTPNRKGIADAIRFSKYHIARK